MGSEIESTRPTTAPSTTAARVSIRPLWRLSAVERAPGLRKSRPNFRPARRNAGRGALLCLSTHVSRGGRQHYVLALSCEVSCADSFHGLKFDRYFLAHLRAHPMRQPRRATLERAAGNGAQQAPSYPCSIRPAGEKLSSFVLPEHLLRATTTEKTIRAWISAVSQSFVPLKRTALIKAQEPDDGSKRARAAFVRGA